MKLFNLQITRYEDDYKHRYDNGVYPDKPKIFEDFELMMDYLRNEIDKEIKYSKFYDKFENFKELKDYYSDIDNYYLEVGDSHGHNFELQLKDNVSIKDLQNKFLCGQYVDYHLDYEITKVKIIKKKTW